MRTIHFILLLGAILSGCAAPPPLPQIALKHNDRVGVFIEIGDTPTHTHVGTTAFNNFKKKYPYDWKLSSEVRMKLNETLSNAGFVPVDLNAQGMQYEDLANLIQASGQNWQIAPGKEQTLLKLQNRLGLKALIALKESRVMVDMECTGGPCAERYADASGLFSRTFFGLSSYKAVAAFKWDVYVIDPLANMTVVEPLMSKLVFPGIYLKNFPKPINFDNLTEEELRPVREEILHAVGRNAVEITKQLN